MHCICLLYKGILSLYKAQILQIWCFELDNLMLANEFVFSIRKMFSMFKRTSEISLDRLAKLILVSLYYRGRNACHRHVTLSRTLARSLLSLLHLPVHPASRCPISSAIYVTATFIRGTTDRSVGQYTG